MERYSGVVMAAVTAGVLVWGCSGDNGPGNGTGSDKEDTAALCKDKKDNDKDGYTDCADQDCQLFVFCVKKDGGQPKKDGPVVTKDGPVATKDGPVANKDGPVANKDGPVVNKDGPVVNKDGPVVNKDGPVISPDKGKTCGNGLLNQGEECDGTKLNNKTCYLLGYDGGKLSCNTNCTFNKALCYKCGDGVVNGAEKCDGGALGNKTCQTEQYDGGTLKCNPNCTLDTSGCYKCGDKKMNGQEQCDGSDYGGKTCALLGYVGGNLGCTGGCNYDFSNCYKCGDGKKNGTEECDGTDLGGATCVNKSFHSGTVKCINCKLDYGYCRTSSYVTVNKGTFKMGSSSGEACRWTYEFQANVTLTHSFEIQDGELTQYVFHKNMNYNPSLNYYSYSSYPVENVTWHEAVYMCNMASKVTGQPFCYNCTGSLKNWTCTVDSKYAGKKIYDCPGFRLPTEAEWEMAARAGKTTSTYAGNITNCSGKDSVANTAGWYNMNASGGKSQPVGIKKNSWGISDMAGNVWEWTLDTWKSNPGGGTDPAFTGGSSVVVKGGGAEASAGNLRHARRGEWQKTAKSGVVGFRCARTVK